MASEGEPQGPYAAIRHMDDVLSKQVTRLYVGGLERMIDQKQNDLEIRQLFKGFDL